MIEHLRLLKQPNKGLELKFMSVLPLEPVFEIRLGECVASRAPNLEKVWSPKKKFRSPTQMKKIT